MLGELVLIGSVSKMGGIYCAQVFLEEYKYIAKEKEVTRHRHITEHLQILSKLTWIWWIINENEVNLCLHNRGNLWLK